MASESTASSIDKTKLKSDDLDHLAEGDIYVDEKGKKYRVHKTIMSDRFIGGPHGLGKWFYKVFNMYYTFDTKINVFLDILI